MSSTSHGYFAGGQAPSPIAPTPHDETTSVDRLDYANDSVNSSPKGPLANARNRCSATGNTDYGWVAGAYITDPSTVNRIDYSNDTATAPARGNLSRGGSYSYWALAGVGNQNFGYFTGGADSTTCERVDYSNDTPQATAKGP